MPHTLNTSPPLPARSPLSPSFPLTCSFLHLFHRPHPFAVPSVFFVRINTNISFNKEMNYGFCFPKDYSFVENKKTPGRFDLARNQCIRYTLSPPWEVNPWLAYPILEIPENLHHLRILETILKLFLSLFPLVAQQKDSKVLDCRHECF